jgi:hypothetical protein
LIVSNRMALSFAQQQEMAQLFESQLEMAQLFESQLEMAQSFVKNEQPIYMDVPGKDGVK